MLRKLQHHYCEPGLFPLSLSRPQEVCSHVTSLQGQLGESQARAVQGHEVNDQLSTENAELVDVNGQLLHRVREGEKRGEDLTQLLQIISEGVAEGNLKVSAWLFSYRIAGNFRWVKFSLSGLENVFSWSYFRCMP